MTAPPPTLVAVVAVVAVAAFPPMDRPEAVPVSPVPAPLNAVAVRVPVEGTNWSLVELVYSVVRLPVVWFAKSGYLALVVVVSSVTVA